MDLAVGIAFVEATTGKGDEEKGSIDFLLWCCMSIFMVRPNHTNTLLASKQARYVIPKRWGDANESCFG